MKIAVTGASGFVGRHVVNALAGREGVELVAVSRSAAPIEGLPPAVRQVTLDIADTSPDDYARLGEPEMLVHLAWGGLPNYLSRHHFEVELPAHYNFLSAMVGAGLPAMLVTGTCYEYGMADGELFEDREPKPANAYAFAKTALLRQLEFLKKEQPFELTWARLFYMWGPGQSQTSIYSQLMAAAAKGDAAFPMSKGEQLRDYLPIGQVATILADFALLRVDAGVVNVSSGEPISVRALVERWIAEEGIPIAPELGRYPYPAYEPLAFWGSSAKRRALLAPDG